MEVHYQCQWCGHTSEAFFAKAGDITRCVHCGARVVVFSRDGSDESLLRKAEEIEEQNRVRFKRTTIRDLSIQAVIIVLFYGVLRSDSLGLTQLRTVLHSVGFLVTGALLALIIYQSAHDVTGPASYSIMLKNCKLRWVIWTVTAIGAIIALCETLAWLFL